jgi:hypothetical protein
VSWGSKLKISNTTPWGGVDGAGERPHLARHELLDGGDEAVLRDDLKEHARLPDALVLAHLHHRALGRQQRVLERADQRVGTGEAGPRVGRAELFLAELDQRAPGRWPARSGLARSSRLCRPLRSATPRAAASRVMNYWIGDSAPVCISAQAAAGRAA